MQYKLLKKIRFKFIELIIELKKFLFNKKQTTVESSDTTLFFILGSGRNGSTLLAQLLNKHSKIFLPPEQYALPYTIADWQLSFFRSWDSYCRKQLNRYFSNNQNWKLDQNDYEIIENNLKKVENKDRGPRNLFKIVFQQYSNRFGDNKKIVGDHSPISTVFYRYIFYEFSRDKFIFLIRHPFDVVLSYSKMANNPASDPSIAAWKWNNSIKTYDYLRTNNCKVLLVKYEDLVSNPDESIKRVLDFIDVDYENLTSEKTKADNNDSLGTKGLPYHQNLNRPINSDSVNKWRKELSPEIVSKIRKSVHKNALRFDYNIDLDE